MGPLRWTVALDILSASDKYHACQSARADLPIGRVANCLAWLNFVGGQFVAAPKLICFFFSLSSFEFSDFLEFYFQIQLLLKNLTPYLATPPPPVGEVGSTVKGCLGGKILSPPLPEWYT